jgi:hypothetical protein
MTKARWMVGGVVLGSVGVLVGEYALLVRVVKRRFL